MKQSLSELIDIESRISKAIAAKPNLQEPVAISAYVACQRKAIKAADCEPKETREFIAKAAMAMRDEIISRVKVADTVAEDTAKRTSSASSASKATEPKKGGLIDQVQRWHKSMESIKSADKRTDVEPDNHGNFIDKAKLNTETDDAINRLFW